MSLLNPFESMKTRVIKILETLTFEEYKQIKRELEKKYQPKKSYETVGDLTDKEKAVLTNEVAKKLEEAFRIMKFDIDNDPHMKETALRIASMWINEYFAGRYNHEPVFTTFQDDEDVDSDISMITEYDQRIELDENHVIVAKRINVLSVCSHHFAPYFNLPEQTQNNSYGLIAYIPKDKVIGISKLNRLSIYLGSRPTTQEWLTKAIMRKVSELAGTDDVYVKLKNIIHTCEYTRGVKANGLTTTVAYSGKFKNPKIRQLVEGL
jgi:GTP cyclohydrolase I